MVGQSRSRQIFLRCFSALLLFGSILPACVALFFINQDHLSFWYTESYFYEFELVGVGSFSNSQLLVVAIVVTLLMGAAGTTLFLLSWRR